MATLISKKPAILLEQLRQLKAGLVKYSEEYTPVSPSLSDVDGAITALDTAAQSKQDAAGVAETATATMHTVRDDAVGIARRTRDAVYAYFGKRDPRIVEFGMDTLPTRTNRNGSENNPNG
ncbi:MAG: hypothetical protein HN657_01770 [Candidatus Marinimicrobia bacterium]|jgi:hypothetical protein|nr:hypothetical protein [Candidatus Neomarinimicrobiota bacterium]MBT4144134.1 hypothetical protein [Candidatus Neomarinimicrobiota bacterium]MBT4177074.1 hypothetical protein [Candidatus Neomarinimicrobiota bacterium]MBT5404487.1 hypothetical protein [Candidatus Neomarinimicrobiota bacterium]MBT6159432.1 hypothetical protein [Candidatus Neomarinimicrobiota bacterium]